MNNNTYTVFFGGLKESVTNDNLRQWTEMFGDVSNIRIIPNKKNPTGLRVGFAEFDNQESLDTCLAFYHENPLEVEGITLTIALAKEKTERAKNNDRHSYSHSYDRNRSERAPRRYADSEGYRPRRSDDNEDRPARRFNDRNDNHRSSQRHSDYRSDRRTSSRYNNFDDNDGLYEYEAHRSNRSYHRYND